MALFNTSAGTVLKAGVSSPYHPATQAALTWLINNGQTLTQPEIDALDRLVRDLHGEANPNYPTSDIWNKFLALYPVIGSTAISHSLNLVNPGAFHLTYDAGITHSATGIATSATARVHMGFISATHLQRINKHIGYRNIAFVGIEPVASTYFRNATLDGVSVDILKVDAAGDVYPSLSEPGTFHIGFPFNTRSLTTVYRGADVRSELMNGSTGGGGNNAAAATQNTSEILFWGATDAGAPYTMCWGSVGFDFGSGPEEEEAYTLNLAQEAYQTALGRVVTFNAAALSVLALLLSLGIFLTYAQQKDLNALLEAMPAPPAAAMAKKAKKKPSVKDIPPAVLDYLKSLGHKI
jgi:hypothetical protein